MLLSSSYQLSSFHYQNNLAFFSFIKACILMASHAILIRASILLILLAALFTFAEPSPLLDSQMLISTGGVGSSLWKTHIECGGACKFRCSKSSRPRLCRRACGTCCARCNCVPPGTYGNQYLCPCYAALTTHHGKRKCP